MSYYQIRNKLVLIGCLFIVACSPVYIPSAPMVFNNQELGDFEFNLRQGALSTNVQGGYAVTDHINVGMTYSALYFTDQSVAIEESSPSHQPNLVLGYYNKLTATHLLEVNVGGGPVLNVSTNRFDNYYKAYIQPSITFHNINGLNTDFSMLMRISGATFRELQVSSLDTYYQGYIEPVLSLSLGDEVRFNSQLGLSIPMQQNTFFENSPIILNIGIGYRLPRRKTPSKLPVL